VYVHDVEYVCERAQPPSPGDPATALADRSAYGIAEGQEARILGPGDEKLLEAIGELRKLKAEGVIKAIGISGTHAPPLSPRAAR
jgi:D-arabinose 1-dehydrogenase